MRELVYYVAVSLDGYIAGPAGEFDAFLVEGDHMDGINDRFADAIPTDLAAMIGVPQTGDMFDTVLMGWNTYAVGLPDGMTSPYRHLKQYVFSRSHTAQSEDVETISGDPVELVRRLKEEGGKSIWLCGGGQLATTLHEEIDRLVIKRQPLLFGDGIPLFAKGEYAPARFDAVSTTAFESGVVFTEYVRRRGE